MKKLKDICESIFDDGVEDQLEDSAIFYSYCQWLVDNVEGIKLRWVQRICFGFGQNHWNKKDAETTPAGYDGRYIYQDGKFNLPLESTLTLSDKIKLPEGLKISSAGRVIIKDYTGKELPLSDLTYAESIGIHRCPNIKSIDVFGKVECVTTFAISNCPKLESLKGCPKEVTELFKAVNCGKKFTSHDIKKYCKVRQKDMIY